jgi:hypothetical protein
VRAATNYPKEHASNKIRSSWRGCRHSRSVPDLFLRPRAGFQSAFHGLALRSPGRRRVRGAMSAVRRTADAMELADPALARLEGFRSTFAPPDAEPHGTGRNGQGHPGTAEAVERPFAHVMGDGRGQVGMRGDSRGDGAATCKIAGIAYTGSNPVPATLPLSCGNAACYYPIRPGSTLRFPSSFPPPDAPPTPSDHLGAPRRRAEHALDQPGLWGTQTWTQPVSCQFASIMAR